MSTLHRDALSGDPAVAGPSFEALITLGARAIEEMIELTIATRDSNQRIVAAGAVRHMLEEASPAQRTGACRALLRAVGSTDSDRYRAGNALLISLIEPLTPELIKQGLGHSSRLVRRSVAIAAGETRAAPFAEHLIKMLGSVSQPERRDAVRALGNIGDPASISPLRSLYVSETQLEVRQALREALSALGVE